VCAIGRPVARVIKPLLGFEFQNFNNSIWKLKILMFLYCLANFFQNFGPNVTTFVIPGEVFPTRYRATGHGFSAACGKLGAIVAQIIFYLHGNSIQAMYALLNSIVARLISFLPPSALRSLVL
jgi:MFS transporter, PHS family, inorganic phosphate transporter